MQERKCKACGAVKALTEFPPYTANGVRGHRHTCRNCWNGERHRQINRVRQFPQPAMQAEVRP